MMATLEFKGKHLEFLNDPTPEILVEGSLSSGKSTVGIWKELLAAEKYTGIWILITRWTDDAVKTLLKPAIEQLARIKGISLAWNNSENYYALENGSRIFAFGLKTQSSDPMQRYAKIRGLPVSRILFDQAEQGPKDVVGELRFRLRPDIEARLKGIEYPRQLTFLANPVNDSHILAIDFPDSNKIHKNRKLYQFSLLDNAHVLPQEMVDSLLADYPPEHPLFPTRIMGQRGLTIIGDAVYENLFERATHVKPLSASGPLIEGFHVGTHNPAWIIGQRTYSGGLTFLGGILSKRPSLDDFLSEVKHYRSEWFGASTIRTCTSPMGEIGVKSGNRFTLMNLLRTQKFKPVSKESANAPDVRLALIEEISARLRRRVGPKEEAITVNADPARWLQMLPNEPPSEKPFLAFAFEGGYTWDEHTVSVSNKELRQPHEDDEYANAMHCVENMVLNFCIGQKTDEERREQRNAKRGSESAQDRQRYRDPQSWLAS